MEPIFLFFIVLTILLLCLQAKESFTIIKETASDNKVYYVQDYENPKEAANILSKLINNSLQLIDYLSKKYPEKENVARLKEKFNPDKIREAVHEKNSTSYTINKGEMMHLCLRNKDKNKTLHEQNLLMFVIIHELAHIASQSIGHNTEFYENFKFLLNESAEIGIYHPVNFKNNPEEYCGINVTNNPYFEKFINL
jgi:predicted metal-dependent hydrolase